MSTIAQKTVYLLVGPRGAGKSTYIETFIAGQPDFRVVSRDEILMQMIGTVHPSPYSGCMDEALELMNSQLHMFLSRSGSVKVILDTWNGTSVRRRFLISQLREFGADRVVALYFITPVELVNEWFWKKPGLARISEMKTRLGQGLTFYPEEAPTSDYHSFHQLAENIDFDGFDQVIRIDPTQGILRFE